MYVVKRGWVWDGGCGWGGVGLGCWWWGRGSGVVGVGGKCTYGPQWRRRVVNGVGGGGGVVNGFRGVSDLQQGYHTVTVANRQEKYPRYRYFFLIMRMSLFVPIPYSDWEDRTYWPYSSLSTSVAPESESDGDTRRPPAWQAWGLPLKGEPAWELESLLHGPLAR